MHCNPWSSVIFHFIYSGFNELVIMYISSRLPETQSRKSQNWRTWGGKIPAWTSVEIKQTNTKTLKIQERSARQQRVKAVDKCWFDFFKLLFAVEIITFYLNTVSATTTIFNSRGETFSSSKPSAKFPLKSTWENSDDEYQSQLLPLLGKQDKRINLIVKGSVQPAALNES